MKGFCEKLYGLDPLPDTQLTSPFLHPNHDGEGIVSAFCVSPSAPIAGDLQKTSCRRAAATVCPRPSPPPVGAEAPSAAEQTAT